MFSEGKLTVRFTLGFVVIEQEVPRIVAVAS